MYTYIYGLRASGLGCRCGRGRTAGLVDGRGEDAVHQPEGADKLQEKHLPDQPKFERCYGRNEKVKDELEGKRLPHHGQLQSSRPERDFFWIKKILDTQHVNC